MRLLDRGDQLAHLALHLLDAARRAVEQIIEVEKVPGSAGCQAAQVDLRTEARMDRVAAAHAHRRARAGELLDLGELLPDHAGQRSRAVAQLQAQVVAAVATLASLGLAHQQNLVDLGAVGELVDEHVSEGRWERGRDAPAARDRHVC